MWTLEQEAAIRLRHSDLLISAAAGSGKTAVLVERITRLIIEESIPIDQMLIVTYTNAAAGEMRERIERALSNALMSKGSNTFLQTQIKHLNRAHIKTFHAFCLDVVRQNFQLLEIDPSFRMANESERQIMSFQALEETLEQFYEAEDDAFIALVEGYSSNRDDKKLREMILNLHRFIQSQPYPLQWLENQKRAYAEDQSAQKMTWLHAMVTYFKERLAQGLDLLRYAMTLCEHTEGLEGYYETLSLDYKGFEQLLKADETQFEAQVNAFAFSRMKPIKKGIKEQIDPLIIKEVKDDIRDKIIKKQIFEPIKTFYDYKSTTVYLEELSEQADLVAILYELVATYHRMYQEAKRKRNILDFNDLEHDAIKVLDDNSIAKRYQMQFQYIFVDEYQDASGIQEQILKSIKRQNGLFMVGDIKQSIYKFRLAEPEIFIRKYHAFQSFSDFDIKDSKGIMALNQALLEEGRANEIRVDLSKNFRTRPEILSAVNDLFGDVMRPEMGDIAYDDQAKLYPGMAFPPSDIPAVTINLISKERLETYENDEDQEVNDFFEEMKTDEIEARAAAMTIKEQLGTPIYHPKEERFAPCTFKDIVLLIRSVRSWTPIFETVFAEEGIPLFADNPSGYFETLEINFMMSLIQVISNPYDDLALLTVLRSPIVGFDLSALIDLKMASKGKRYLFDGFDAYLAMPQTPNHEKLLIFLKKLDHWRFASRHLSLDLFMWRLLRESTLYEYCMAMPGGQARIANLNILIERASEFRQSQIVSLNQFVTFMKALNKASGDMGVANSIGEQDNVVRLMSIHKAKGLEFPIVMLLGLGRKFNLMDTYGDLLVHQHEGLALSYVDENLRIKSKTLPQEVIKLRIKRETYSEELRVLYVALTRPVDRLILFGTYSSLANKWRQWQREEKTFHFNQPQGYMDWVMPQWYNHPQVKVDEKDASDFIKRSVEQLGKWQQRLKMWQKPENTVSDTLFDEIDERLNYAYPEAQAFLPTKVSVSDMTTTFKAPELMTKPEFMSEKTMTGAEKGTLTHKVLEMLDLHISYDKTMLLSWLDTLENKGIIEKHEKKMVALDKIMAFQQNPLGIKLKHIEKHFHEVPFVRRHATQMIQGVIDFYAETPEGIILLDYKTDYKVPVERMAKYEQQINQYCLAIEEITGKPVIEAYIIFLMTETHVKIERRT